MQKVSTVQHLVFELLRLEPIVLLSQQMLIPVVLTLLL